ncbi:hypothetical protein F2P81_022819 [Scophthalmus maximus]|uniref:Uncharacterized protein n=1 Tax=Scophthalmus maximus TaxID=52904 RepID=A0A6A4S1B3_SCOMX|nr:hypothetical protein F2P81_022819 [Scophthalmus maximus]
MESGLSLRVSWTCLLLISSAVGFPAKEGYRYPYAATWSSSGGPGASRPPLASLLQESFAGDQQLEAASQQSSSPSSEAAPVAYSPGYVPYGFIMSYGSSSEEPSSAPEVPVQSPGYVGVPLVSWEETPSLFVPPQPSSGSSEHNNMASTREASSPKSEASQFVPLGVSDPSSIAHAFERYSRVASAPYGNPSTAGSAPEEQPEGRPSSSMYDLRERLASPDFPDFSFFDRTVEAPQGETSPLPPSSYIIQSRNGFLQAREVLSHMKYSPWYPQPPVFPYDAPSKLPPMTGPKGGKTV